MTPTSTGQSTVAPKQKSRVDWSGRTLPALAKAFKNRNVVRTCRQELLHPCRLCNGQIQPGEAYYTSTATDKNSHVNCVEDILGVGKGGKIKTKPTKVDLSIVPTNGNGSGHHPKEETKEALAATTGSTTPTDTTSGGEEVNAELISMASLNYEMGKKDGWREGFAEATKQADERYQQLLKSLPEILRAASCAKTAANRHPEFD